MMMAAARELARHSPARQDRNAPLLPPLEDLRAVARAVAVAVAGPRLRARVAAAQWTPAYDAVP